MKYSAVATPDAEPWNTRKHEVTKGTDRRSNYDIDRDRIVHCESFRDLQYKTQVQGLQAAASKRDFRTRLNHVIEVSQIARSLARAVDAVEPLAEAIALAHDLGHPPFGHAGERALSQALMGSGQIVWNANVHSLTVVDSIERSHLSFPGLDLTWATREGIARHATPFDEPVTFGEFSGTAYGGIECQIVDASDVLAYLSHDLDDALAGDYAKLADVRELSPLTGQILDGLGSEWISRGSLIWPNSDKEVLIRRALVARLIGSLIKDAAQETSRRIAETGVRQAEDVRNLSTRVVGNSQPFEDLIRKLLEFLTTHYYRSERVANDDRIGAEIVAGLFQAVLKDGNVAPERFRKLEPPLAAAYFVASLDDHSAVALAYDLGLLSDRRRS